jgi:hypothetical protein
MTDILSKPHLLPSPTADSDPFSAHFELKIQCGGGEVARGRCDICPYFKGGDLSEISRCREVLRCDPIMDDFKEEALYLSIHMDK